MKIEHTAIIESNDIKEAIIESIKEFFNKKWIENYIELLIVDGNVGKCSYIETEWEHNVYFIATIVAPGLIRVEHCSSMKRNKR